MSLNTIIRSSYEQDYLLWTEETVDQLRNKKFDSPRACHQSAKINSERFCVVSAIHQIVKNCKVLLV